MLLVIHIISLEYGYPICIFGKTSSKLYGNPENPEKSSEEDYKRLYYTKDTKRISPIESFPVKVYWFEKMISL